MAGVGEFAVDFVGDDEDSVRMADLGDAVQFVPGPYAADGVLRVAQEQGGGLRIGGFPCQVFPVDGIGVILVREGVAQFPAPVVPDGGEEGVVAGRMDDHIVARPGESLDTGGISGDDAGRADDLLPGDALPAVTPVEPGSDGVII